MNKKASDSETAPGVDGSVYSVHPRSSVVLPNHAPRL